MVLSKRTRRTLRPRSNSVAARSSVSDSEQGKSSTSSAAANGARGSTNNNGDGERVIPGAKKVIDRHLKSINCYYLYLRRRHVVIIGELIFSASNR